MKKQELNDEKLLQIMTQNFKYQVEFLFLRILKLFWESIPIIHVLFICRIYHKSNYSISKSTQVISTFIVLTL